MLKKISSDEKILIKKIIQKIIFRKNKKNMRKYLSLGVQSSILQNIRKTFFRKYKNFFWEWFFIENLENLPPVLKYKKLLLENY